MRNFDFQKRAALSACSAADTGIVGIGGITPSVRSDSDCRNVLLLSPAGALRMPEPGEEMAVLRLPDKTELALGTLVYTKPEGLENGDVCIAAGSARIILRKSGAIEIEGDVSINGSLSVNGGAVNGT